jgi:preprotein translocase subunit SecY
MSVIDTRLIVLLLVAAAIVALGVSMALAPVRDSESGEAPGRVPGWARLLGALIALLGVAAGCVMIWPGLDMTTAGVAMGISVLLFAVGIAYRRRTGLADEAEQPGATPRPQLGILLTGTGIATAAMVVGVGLAGRLA